MIDTSVDIRNIACGDQTAFNKFVESHSSSLFYYARGIVENNETAEEVVSDVFLEVWKNKDKLTTIENLKAWLFVITYRKAISYLRKETGNDVDSLDNVGTFIMDPIPSPDEKMISNEEMDRINQAIEKLPPKCKHVFYLAKIEGMPYKEIAQILNISVKTINNHIAYALEAIAKKLNISEKKVKKV